MKTMIYLETHILMLTILHANWSVGRDSGSQKTSITLSPPDQTHEENQKAN